VSDYGDAFEIPGQDPDALEEALRRHERPAQSAPQGWEPGIAWDGSEGHLTTGPLEDAPNDALWSELIADWNLDPSTTEVVPGSIQVRGWDANIGGGEVRRLRYYRATIRSRAAGQDRADVEELCRLASAKRPRRPAPEVASDIALVVPISDLQIGKGEGGGSLAAVERIATGIDAITDKVREMTRRGRPPEAIYLLGMGDLVEGCGEHYAMQTFQVDLDHRQQKRVVRRLLMRAVDVSAPLAPRVVLAAIPGNHGEYRKAGKAFTNWDDNADLEVVEGVAEVCAANPERYGNVSAVIARDLTLTLGVCGVNVGMAHGHQYGRASGHAAGKAEKWWSGQVMGRQPIAEADILISGHFHHFVMSESLGRLFVQCPAQDGGSYWWTAQTGQHAPAGQLMLGIGRGYGARGWGDVEIV